MVQNHAVQDPGIMSDTCQFFQPVFPAMALGGFYWYPP